MIAPPVAYTPDLEQAEEGEAETGRELNATLHDILEITSQDYGHAVRSVHAKAHGIIRGDLTIHADLPPELAQGLFAAAGTHPVVMRLSTNPGDILDDSISVPRGVAIKVLEVEGERLPGSEGDTTQDFIMVNGPVFAAPEGKAFLANLKLLAKTTDKAEWAKKGLSAVLRATDAVLSTVGIESSTVRQMGGAPNVHPLGETYFSQTPFLYGRNVAKFSLVPVAPRLTDLTGTTIDASGRPDALREAVAHAMIEGEGVWELRVQLLRDRDSQPVEDPTIEWKEADSPFVTVATLRADAQATWGTDIATRADDRLSFSVWHGLASHRPLGAINRLRQSAYRMSSDYRAAFNGCPIHEPRALAELA